jgi:ribosome-associated protein
MTRQIDPSLDLYVKAALGKKALNLVVLDVHELSSVADVFMICSGRSNRQVKAIAEHILVELKKQNIKPLSTEGMSEGHWVLMDYGHIIIHIFYEPVRSFYDLESLWIDAARIKTKGMEQMETEDENQQSYTEFNGDHDDDYSETI